MQIPHPQSLETLLAREEHFTKAFRQTEAYLGCVSVRDSLRDHVLAVTASGDLRSIIETEKAFLIGDLERYSNSKLMTKSLRRAIEEMEAIEQHLAWVRDAAKYRFIDETHAHHSLRTGASGALPRDDARLAFASHETRLTNLDRSRLSESEKGIVDARRDAIAAGALVYEAQQIRTLGLTAATLAVADEKDVVELP